MMDQDRHFAIDAITPGLGSLWAETLGDPEICIAVLDGPVDESHRCFAAADLARISTLIPPAAAHGPSSRHGTHIASIIFAAHDGPLKGISPRCRGLIVPVFKDGDGDSIAPCSHIDLARAIDQAVQAGAQIVNISGGEYSPSGSTHPLLARAVSECANRGVLIIAAAGNDGCECLHIPGALPSVLAVGAMDRHGDPLGFSNWGAEYQAQGILAPGEDIPGAAPGGGSVVNSGTSYATAVASGVAALLLSLQRKLGGKPDPPAVRAALLQSVRGCDEQPVPDCRRLLAGRLDIQSALLQIKRGTNTMSETTTTPQDSLIGRDAGSGPGAPAFRSPPATGALPSESAAANPEIETPGTPESAAHGSIKAAACECGRGAAAPPQLVFAIGQLGYDFGTEARRDSIAQHMRQPANPHDPVQLLTYLRENPWDAAAVLWTLNLDATPIYAIQAQGAFAGETYRRLGEFLAEQSKGEVERISLPGYIAGSARLYTGQVVPVVWPVLRGLYSWNTMALIGAVCGPPPPENAPQKDKDEHGGKAQAVANFLRRVYEELRNLGSTPQNRAINYSATNAFAVAEIFKDAIKEQMDFDTIEVGRSPICRPDSDCWDVKLTFFNPKKVFEQARKAYRFTVDVSDVVPVTVGPVRSWFVR